MLHLYNYSPVSFICYIFIILACVIYMLYLYHYSPGHEYLFHFPALVSSLSFACFLELEAYDHMF